MFDLYGFHNLKHRTRLNPLLDFLMILVVLLLLLILSKSQSRCLLEGFPPPPRNAMLKTTMQDN